ncbi:hypothetical protein CC80DRAFT_498559 [Byssothecium circinans]|uniref:Uncharacterized protein n=1 Tax=Byssothecium circinans TaxID=147558 RepID=A0A6A5UDT2_9PLEO|nr:hypothetical protein CC80DRAFT_498559 [Byssothecium circinans]
MPIVVPLLSDSEVDGTGDDGVEEVSDGCVGVGRDGEAGSVGVVGGEDEGTTIAVRWAIILRTAVSVLCHATGTPSPHMSRAVKSFSSRIVVVAAVATKRAFDIRVRIRSQIPYAQSALHTFLFPILEMTYCGQHMLAVMLLSKIWVSYIATCRRITARAERRTVVIILLEVDFDSCWRIPVGGAQ